MSQTIRWGMIGCGDVTERKSGPAFQKARNSSLVAVMARRPEQARDWAARHGVPRWYSDAQQLIDDPEVDAVYVATPPSTHRQFALLCAAACKPAYVEKPMALDAAECAEMVVAFRDANTPLFVAYYRRALPRFLRIREVIESGEIGKPRFARITHFRPVSDADRRLPWRVDPSIAGGGLFVDLAPHTLDVLAWMLGRVTEASGIADSQAGIYPAEDVVTASLHFASGAVGSGLWCFNAAEREESVLIMGDSGSLRFSIFGEGPFVIRTASGQREETVTHPEHIQQPLIQSIVDELNGEGKCPSTGETGMDTTLVIDAILKGWREKRARG